MAVHSLARTWPTASERLLRRAGRKGPCRGMQRVVSIAVHYGVCVLRQEGR